MPVSHAPDTSVASPDERATGEVPGLLEVLARIPDPRRRRGRRFVPPTLLLVILAEETCFANKVDTGMAEGSVRLDERRSCWRSRTD